MDNLLGVAAFGGEGPSPLTRAAALETATLIGTSLYLLRPVHETRFKQ